MKMRIVLEDGAYMPVRAHPTDAGLDIMAMEGGVVKAGQSQIFRTGVHVELPPNTGGLFVSKSGLMMYMDITSTGLIDEQYQGEIMVKLFNHGDRDFVVMPGDKISQLVVIDVKYPEPVLVDKFRHTTDRGNSGFGSTGR